MSIIDYDLLAHSRMHSPFSPCHQSTTPHATYLTAGALPPRVSGNVRGAADFQCGPSPSGRPYCGWGASIRRVTMADQFRARDFLTSATICFLLLVLLHQASVRSALSVSAASILLAHLPPDETLPCIIAPVVRQRPRAAGTLVAGRADCAASCMWSLRTSLDRRWCMLLLLQGIETSVSETREVPPLALWLGCAPPRTS